MIVIKVLEPIGKDEKIWMQEFQKEGVSIEYRDTRGWPEKELMEYVKDSQILVLVNRPLSRSVIEHCLSLKLVVVAFTGIDHIDLDACREKSIEVKNTPGYATHAVAELTVCLAIALARNLVVASQSLLKKESFPVGLELYGKKVGIIGGGSIGMEVRRLFLAFGCEVLLFHHRPLEDKQLNQVDLADLLKVSDFVSLHIPLKKETRHFLNKEKLSWLKPSAFLMNTGRGALIEEEALFQVLKERKIAGAALDVLEQEPPLSAGHPFLDLPNVILAPHIGYRTKEAALRKADMAIGHLKKWLLLSGLQVPSQE